MCNVPKVVTNAEETLGRVWFWWWKKLNCNIYGFTTYKFEYVKLEWKAIYHELDIEDFEMGKEDIVEDYQCLQ